MRVGESQGEAHAQVLSLAPGVVATALSLDPAAGFLLSRIDGRTNWGTLRQISALPSHEVDRLIEAWLKQGVVVASVGSAISKTRPNKSCARAAAEAHAKPAATQSAPPKQPPPQPAAPPRGAAGPKPLVLPDPDASLELELELQREILDFAKALGRRHHEILGVGADADARVVKKAYFALSKKLHPDRYFRRNTGAFAPVIEACFKRLLEAYELLSDPAARKEAQQREVEPVFATVDAATASQARASSVDARRRLRERVSTMAGHARAHQERKRKAKSFFEHGMSAFAASKWLEAAGAVRLAISFDPENAAYREEFPNVQRKAHEERAKFFVSKGEGALEMRDYAVALDHFEEALHFRPGDAELAYRAAKLSLQISQDLKRTKEFAAQAVDVDPKNAAYRKLLADVYAAAGLNANAKREYEAALRIDPNDKEAKSALRSVR
jgi:curved DNA-binding protein CbpA